MKMRQTPTIIIAAALALCIVLSAFPVFAAADELSLDKPQRITCAGGNTTTLYFTAPENGDYIFGALNASKSVEPAITVSCSGSSWSTLYNIGRLFCHLIKGETYEVRAGSSAGDGVFDLCVSFAVKATSIEILPVDTNGIAYMSTEVTARFEPWNAAAERITWAVDDDKVATISRDGSFNVATVRFMNPGSVIVRAYCDSGLSTSVKFSVRDMDTIYDGETKDAEIAYGGMISYFRFVPEKSGTYSFSSALGAGVRGAICDKGFCEMASGEGENFDVVCSLTEGDTYFLTAQYISGGVSGSFKVTLKSIPSAEVKVFCDDVELGTFAPGEEITLPVPKPETESGGVRRFYTWSGADVKRGDFDPKSETENGRTYTLTVPDSDVRLTAVYVWVGDLSGDGLVTLTDIADMKNLLSSALASDESCYEASDVNFDGLTTITDLTYFKSMLAGGFSPER